MKSMNEYSLWIVPLGKIYNRMTSIISTLSERYKAPCFEPHITLLGDIAGTEKDVMFKSYEFANSIKHFKIRLTKADCSDEYFKCVFIRAEKTGALMEAGAEARELFNRRGEYMPHLSLLYGNYPRETKEQVIAEIGKDFNVEFDVNNIHLAYSSKNVPIDDWRIIREFPLQSE